MSDPPAWTPPEQPPAGGSGWPPPPSQQPPPPPEQPPTQQWAPPPPPGGYQQYGYPGYAPPRRTEGNAIAALVLSLVSLTIFWCLPVAAVVALFLAASAKKKIRASGGALDGEGLATAGTIISWVHIGLWVVGVIVIIIVAIAGGFDENTSTYDFNSLGALAGPIT